MKGIIVKSVGGPYELVDNLEKPSPRKGQILVKSLVTGINPVENIMQSTGVLVTAWPIVLGCDASGVVVEVGPDVTKFKVGDKAFGCTRLGTPGYSTFQEYFLMDANLAFKNDGTLSTEQAATVGVGLLTATLGLIAGTRVGLVLNNPPKDDAEWVVVLGAAGAVGSFAVQLATICGYKVLGSCSPSNDKIVKGLGAKATINYKTPIATQIGEIGRITEGKFSRIFDASAMSTETGMGALAKHGDLNVPNKYFATTNDWSPIEEVASIQIYKVELGMIGRSGDLVADKTNKNITDYIPNLEVLLKGLIIKPMPYEQVGGVGLGEVLKALEKFGSRKGDGKKVVVRLAEE